MAKTAHSIKANTFQFFTRNPRGGKAKDISDEDIAEFHRLCSEYSIGKIVAHSPYTLNPCSADEKIREFARITFADDLKRMEKVPGNYYNFHPGSHVGQGTETGIAKLRKSSMMFLTKNKVPQFFWKPCPVRALRWEQPFRN